MYSVVRNSNDAEQFVINLMAHGEGDPEFLVIGIDLNREVAGRSPKTVVIAATPAATAVCEHNRERNMHLVRLEQFELRVTRTLVTP